LEAAARKKFQPGQKTLQQREEMREAVRDLQSEALEGWVEHDAPASRSERLQDTAGDISRAAGEGGTELSLQTVESYGIAKGLGAVGAVVGGLRREAQALRMAGREAEALNLEAQATAREAQALRAAPKGGTYVLRDAEGQAMRTGRSKDLARRAGEHRRAPTTKDLEFEVDRRTDVYPEQRGREQVIHDQHNPALDKVRPISPTNPRRQEYLDAAKRLEEE
jgi:hypothetical protein